MRRMLERGRPKHADQEEEGEERGAGSFTRMLDGSTTCQQVCVRNVVRQSHTEERNGAATT